MDARNEGCVRYRDSQGGCGHYRQTCRPGGRRPELVPELVLGATPLQPRADGLTWRISCFWSGARIEADHSSFQCGDLPGRPVIREIASASRAADTCKILLG